MKKKMFFLLSKNAREQGINLNQQAVRRARHFFGQSRTRPYKSFVPVGKSRLRLTTESAFIVRFYRCKNKIFKFDYWRVMSHTVGSHNVHTNKSFQYI